MKNIFAQEAALAEKANSNALREDAALLETGRKIRKSGLVNNIEELGGQFRHASDLIEGATSTQALTYLGSAFGRLQDGLKDGTIPSTTMEDKENIKKLFQGIINDTSEKYNGIAYTVSNDEAAQKLIVQQTEALTRYYDGKDGRAALNTAKTFLNPTFNKMSIADFHTSMESKGNRLNLNRMLGSDSVKALSHDFVKKRLREQIQGQQDDYQTIKGDINFAANNNYISNKEKEESLSFLQNKMLNEKILLDPAQMAAEDNTLFKILQPMMGQSINSMREMASKESDPLAKTVMSRYYNKFLENYRKQPLDATNAAGLTSDTIDPVGVANNLGVQFKISNGQSGVMFSSTEIDNANHQGTLTTLIDSTTEAQRSLDPADFTNSQLHPIDAAGNAVMQSGDKKQAAMYILSERKGVNENFLYNNVDMANFLTVFNSSDYNRKFQSYKSDVRRKYPDYPTEDPTTQVLLGMSLYQAGAFGNLTPEEKSTVVDGVVENFHGKQPGFYTFGADPSVGDAIYKEVGRQEGLSDGWGGFFADKRIGELKPLAGGGYLVKGTKDNNTLYFNGSGQLISVFNAKGQAVKSK